MYDARLAEFSRERLDGRPIPDDLRVLLIARDYDALDHSGLGVDPEEFLDDLVDAEREKLGIL